MAIQIDCYTGQIVGQDGGADVPLRRERYGALVTQDAHGRYYEAVARGNVFLASNSATQALSVNSTTATGLILSNPAGSGRNAAILEVCVAIASLPAGQYNLILTANTNPVAAATTHTVALTIRSALIGVTGNSVCFADSQATIANSTIVRVIGAGGAATMAGSTSYPPFIRDEIAGLIVLTPGTCLALQSLTTAVTVVASIMWEELIP